MKKLLICLLLLPSLAWGQDYARMNPYILGSAASTTAFCTGAATCTATTPGACDMWCEDFEGSTDCDGAGDGTDENCRNAYTTNITSGDAIDFTSTASGTYPCTGTTNTNVLKITAADADSDFIQWDVGGLQNTVWGQTYFTVTSSSLALNGTIMVLHANNLSGYNLAAFSVYLKKDTSGYHFEMSYINSTPGTSYIACSNGTASLNQWYRVGVYYSNSSANTEAKLFVDGTQCGSTGTDVGSRQARYFLLGSGLILPQGFSAEWDNLTIDNDNDATPGECL